MALTIIKFNLDINPGLAPQIINVSEYDINRQFIISITENGKPFQIPANTTATIEGTLNQRGFQTTGNINSNTVSFILTEAMTASKGRAWVKIKLIQDNKSISTCGFWLNVDRAGVEAETVIGASGFEQQIVDAVQDWLDEHPPASGGLTDDVKTALLDCFENVAWINEDGQQYYDALYDALYPPVDVLSISAVFTQGSAVIYDTDSLDDLKQYLVVAATMTDSTTQTVTNYTLSGTLTVGTSTITASYGGKTATFNVIVSALPWDYEWDATSGEAPTYNGAALPGSFVDGLYKADECDFADIAPIEVEVEFKSTTSSRQAQPQFSLAYAIGSGFKVYCGNSGNIFTTVSGTAVDTGVEFPQNTLLTLKAVSSADGCSFEFAGLSLSGTGLEGNQYLTRTGFGITSAVDFYLSKLKYRYLGS